MSAFKVVCPHCWSPLRSEKSPRPGKEVDCPLCSRRFVVDQKMIQACTGSTFPGVPMAEILPDEAVAELAAIAPPAATPAAPAMGILVTARPRKPTPPPVSQSLQAVPVPIANASASVVGLSGRTGVWLAAGAGLLAVMIALLAGLILSRGGENLSADPGPVAEGKPSTSADVAGPGGGDAPRKDLSRPEAPSSVGDPPRKEVDAPAPKKAEEAPKVVVPPDPPKKDEEPKKAPAPIEPPMKAAPVFSGPATPGLPGVEPEHINRAVLNGSAYLKRHQHATGSWTKGGHGVGYAALCGLTLLECKFPARDPSIQQAAAYVRTHSAKLDQTYDLSLAVLFLDRLGDARDKVLIQGLALRLVAGQNEFGGWDYRCPLLSPPEMYHLITYLQKTQPKVALQLPKKTEKPDPAFQPPGDAKAYQVLDVGDYKPMYESKRDYDLYKDDADREKKPIDMPKSKPDAAKSEPREKPAEAGGAEGGKVKEVGAKPKILPKGGKAPPGRPEFLPPSLRDVPAVVKGKGAMRKGRDDNSNTQFAILALWAARRHGVPTEFTLQLVGERFCNSQNSDGGWGYQMRSGSTGPMTCAGLLGLAVGIGTAPEFPSVKADPTGKPALDNAFVDRGLVGLGRFVGQPSLIGDIGRTQNLYFLWSVERVAMMYDLRTINGKDWYGWGAQVLLKHQNAEGSWNGERYPGSDATIDTCLALLFLKRSNLADDLTRNFKHFLVIRDPGEK